MTDEEANWHERYHNFLDLYLYHCGISEVPKRYHLWCALSVIASLVGDRVWLNVSEGKQVYPNLYVFLVGPSGCGKGAAIDVAMKLIEGIESANLYSGMATKQAFIDYLVKDGQIGSDGMKVAVQPRVMFVTEELAMSLPQGDLAYGLLTFMTGIFMRPSQPIIEGTRSRGYNKIVKPTCNWLAGSNEAWLIESVPKSAMESGFLARVCLVQAKRDRSIRHPRVLFPPDYAAAKARLRAWAEAYTWVEGEYSISPEAVAIHDHWYMTRPEPEDKALDPSFFRADEMVYKLALLFALADWNGQFNEDGSSGHSTIVQAAHMTEAIESWTDLTFDIGGVVDLASTTPQSADVLTVREIVERFGTVDRSTLMRKASNRGLNRDRLDKAVATLVESETIIQQQAQQDGRMRRWYLWNQPIPNSTPMMNGTHLSVTGLTSLSPPSEEP